MTGSLADTLFDEAPPRSFSRGQIFISAPDLTSARKDPENGYWHCDIADHDSLTWSDKVYELFGLVPRTPIDRDLILTRYTDHSRDALERVRKYALSQDFCFILDAEISADGASTRWIRVLAVPILVEGRVVALEGVKRALRSPSGEAP